MLLKFKVPLFFSVNAESDKKINDKIMINFGLQFQAQEKHESIGVLFSCCTNASNKKFFQC